MAPSDGSASTMLTLKNMFLIAVSSLAFLTKLTAGLNAQTRFIMDSRNDCLYSGFQNVPRGQTSEVRATSTSGSRGGNMNCYIKLSPETRGDELRVYFREPLNIGNSGVKLSISMEGETSKNYDIYSNSPRTNVDIFSKQDGKVTIQLTRLTLNDIDYSFSIAVRAQRSVIAAGSDSEGNQDIGLIAGLVAGIIAIIIILAVICVCCRRRRRENLAKERYHLEKQDLTKESFNTSVGYENKLAANSRVDTASTESPVSDQRPLVDKQRPALDRFGPSPSQRRRQLNSQDEGSNYEDVEQGQGRRPSEGRGNRGFRDREPDRRRRDEYTDDSEDSRRNDLGRREFGRRRDEDAPRRDREASPGRQGLPSLSELKNSSQFRRSFHENELASAADQLRRLPERDEDSSGSSGMPRPPKLPRVPKSPPRSPSPQRRGEKIAGIFRARPTSNGSEINRVEEEVDTPRLTPQREEEEEEDMNTRHNLRPNRGNQRRPREEKRRDRRDEEDSEDERRRERDRRDEEKERRRRQEEEEEAEEEERCKRKEEKKRRDEKRRQEEEEEDRKSRRREKEQRERDRDDDESVYEGRFKKSASGRKSKGKGKSQKMARERSRSTGNALDELENNYQRSRSKSPSSVRSLNFVEDDDDDDGDSGILPFKRSGSKTSLYASRSSLYGRRRKNSIGETNSVTSYAFDDLDSRVGDFDSKNMSHRERERMHRSTGDLASATIVRDIASQTGSDRAVYVFGKKTLAVGRKAKRYNRGTQTTGRERRDSVDSAKSGRSSRSKKLKSRSKSQESLSRRKRSRSRHHDDSDDDDDDDESDRDRRRGGRSKSRNKDFSDDDSDNRRRRHRSKSRGISDDDDDTHSKSSRSKPKPRPRKSTAASIDLSDSDDGKSGPSLYHPPAPAYPQAMYPPAVYPVYPPQGVAYLPTAPGGPPLPHGAPINGAHALNPQRPPLAPKPKKSKWDQLNELTEGVRQQGGPIAETESVMSASVYGRGPQGGYYPPSYNAAQTLPDPNSTFSTAYPESTRRSYYPSDSAV